MKNQTNHVGRSKPLILVSNDDGIDAPGIRALASVMSEFGRVVVVAPVEEKSGTGHAITVRNPVRVQPWPFRIPSGMVEAHAVTGTPADCVKLALSRLLPRRPDLVVSGINHGSNTAVNVMYSGTIAAATEAAILGIDAVAFSLCTKNRNDLEAASWYARAITTRVLQQGMPEGVLFNVSIPDLPLEELRGVAVTRLAHARWKEHFVERIDPFGETYYWLSGEFENLDTGGNTDVDAVDRGFVSVTPIQFDLTAYNALEILHSWHWEFETAPGA